MDVDFFLILNKYFEAYSMVLVLYPVKKELTKFHDVGFTILGEGNFIKDGYFLYLNANSNLELTALIWLFMILTLEVYNFVLEYLFQIIILFITNIYRIWSTRFICKKSTYTIGQVSKKYQKKKKSPQLDIGIQSFSIF